jgi:uncharacterized protein (DUF2384 family)
MATTRKAQKSRSKAARKKVIRSATSGQFLAKAKKKPGNAASMLRGGMLVKSLMDARGSVSADLVAKRFGMSKMQLAETVGLPRETVYRAQRLNAPKAQARTTEMLEIVARIVDWAGGEKQALAWYRAEPIAAFGGRTAEALVKEGKAAAVRNYLDHVATGGFA